MVGVAGMRSVFGIAFLTLLGLLCLVSCVFVNYQISILGRKVETYGTFSVQFDSERVFSPQDL